MSVRDQLFKTFGPCLIAANPRTQWVRMWIRAYTVAGHEWLIFHVEDGLFWAEIPIPSSIVNDPNFDYIGFVYAEADRSKKLLIGER